MKRILLIKTDDSADESALRDLHVAATHRTAKGRILITQAPDGVDVGALKGFAHIDSAHSQLDDGEREFVQAFERMLDHRALGVVSSDEALPELTPKRLLPMAVPLPEEAALALPPGQTSGYLAGNVVVGLVVVSGPGDLDFSQVERINILKEVIEATDFLREANPSARIAFDIEFQTVSIATPKEDCSGTCDNFEHCEAIWRNPAMAALGYSANWSGVNTFVRNLQGQAHKKWAYAAYFTKYPLCHPGYASIGGPRLVIKYDDSTWARIKYIFAHETAHIFYAADEYVQGDYACTCEATSGYFDAPNHNCVQCSGSKVPCLMQQDLFELCFWTRRQLGWGGFTAQTNVTSESTAKTSAAPALAAWNGKVYAAYRGELSSSMYLCSYDGSKWGGQLSITDGNGAKTSAGPSLAVLGSRLYVAYRGADSGTLYVCSFDGTQWSDQTRITDKNGAKSSTTPVLCSFNNKLYLYYRGEGSDTFYVCSSADGTTWSSQTRITDQNQAKTSAAPAVAVYGGKMWVSYVGEGGRNLYAFSHDGSAFSAQTKITAINDAQASQGPALASMHGLLYMLYRGVDSSRMWACTFDGKTWLGQWNVTDLNGAETSLQPALAALSPTALTALYCGMGSSSMWSFQILSDAP